MDDRRAKQHSSMARGKFFICDYYNYLFMPIVESTSSGRFVVVV
jgi:hypothetical protein